MRATEVRREKTVRATEEMEKIAKNAMIKKVATSYCDGEEGSNGCKKVPLIQFIRQ